MLVEILKLAKKHKLPGLLEQCEIQFKTIIKEDFNIPSIPSYNQIVEAKGDQEELIPDSKEKKDMKKSNIDGFLFLPDGKVLVINNDLYEEVLKKGIVIDLKQQEGDQAILEEGEEAK